VEPDDVGDPLHRERVFRVPERFSSYECRHVESPFPKCHSLRRSLWTCSAMYSTCPGVTSWWIGSSSRCSRRNSASGPFAAGSPWSQHSQARDAGAARRWGARRLAPHEHRKNRGAHPRLELPRKQRDRAFEPLAQSQEVGPAPPLDLRVVEALEQPKRQRRDRDVGPIAIEPDAAKRHADDPEQPQQRADRPLDGERRFAGDDGAATERLEEQLEGSAPERHETARPECETVQL